MFECIITIKGDGQGRYGIPKKDRTEPVKNFMVDNQYFYNRVRQHILGCPLCDPTEALRHYLERRPGSVTGTLLKNALAYEKRSNRPVKKDVVDEYIWRCNDEELVLRHVYRLSLKQKYDCAVQNLENSWTVRRFLEHDGMKSIMQLAQSCKNLTDEQEILRLLTISEIHNV